MDKYKQAVLEKEKRQCEILVTIRHQVLIYNDEKISPAFYFIWCLLMLGFLIFAFTLIK